VKPRSGEINLAKERSEKRRGAREERGLKESPTISIPESRKTKASKSVELAAAAAAGGGQNPFETTPDFPDESPPPSIVPPEAVPDTVMESFPSEPGSIPITPTKHTDDLNGDLAASTADVEESGLPMTSTKSYDDYCASGHTAADRVRSAHRAERKSDCSRSPIRWSKRRASLMLRVRS
jgi:hypothetical protein